MSKKSLQVILGVFLFSLLYSVLRYHVVGDVGSKDFPLYVLNKAMALTGFILLTINFALGPAKGLGADVPDAWLAARKEMGIVSFILILAHRASLPLADEPMAQLMDQLQQEPGDANPEPPFRG